MDSIMNIIMPEAMISSVANLAKSSNCSNNAIVKLAIARFLFDQTLSVPNIFESKIEIKQLDKTSDDVTKEIPFDRIISVQYTLDDGKIIRIVRENKIH
ncbi:MAG: hypothetical protein KGI25_07635 [Thaumarchaeota archaeon]|nr:hypothetical protein [Nitrososphaerota archaeon]